MKKAIIILGIVLTSGIAALALSIDKKPQTNTVANVTADRNLLIKTSITESSKSNLAQAD